MLHKDVIERFFQGSATKQDIELIADYIYSDEADKELQSILAEEFKKNCHIDQFDKERSIYQILQKIHLTSELGQKKKSNRFNIVKIAATISLLLAFIVIFFMLHPIKNQIAVNESVKEIITKSTLKGQKLRISLPDGSLVVLNSASSIEYVDGFEEDLRSIKLEGEAFFEVQKDEGRPFVVSFGGMKVHVLGTSFNINCRDSAEAVVALVEGEIKIEDSKGTNETILPGEMMRINNKGFRKSNLEYQSIIGWKDGWINFENDNFEKIKKKLEIWYGVTFTVEGTPAGEYHYSGKYKNKSLEEILDGISYVMQFEYQIKQDNIKIMFNP